MRPIPPLAVPTTPSEVNIASLSCGFFSPDKLKIVQLMSYEWPIRFQLKSLLRSGLAHTNDLVAVCEPVSTLIHTDGMDFAADFMRRFAEKLRSKSNSETVVECFRNVYRGSGRLASYEGLSAMWACHPRVLLEGPYDTQSNRVIRRYWEYRDYFLRVEFREENRMAFRWPIEVCGTA